MNARLPLPCWFASCPLPPTPILPSFLPVRFFGPPMAWHWNRQETTTHAPLPPPLDPSLLPRPPLTYSWHHHRRPPSQHVGIQEGRATGPVVVFFFLFSPPPFASFGGCPTDDACVLRTKGGEAKYARWRHLFPPPLSTHCCCCSRDRGTGV